MSLFANATGWLALAALIGVVIMVTRLRKRSGKKVETAATQPKPSPVHTEATSIEAKPVSESTPAPAKPEKHDQKEASHHGSASGHGGGIGSLLMILLVSAVLAILVYRTWLGAHYAPVHTFVQRAASASSESQVSTVSSPNALTCGGPNTVVARLAPNGDEDGNDKVVIDKNGQQISHVWITSDHTPAIESGQVKMCDHDDPNECVDVIAGKGLENASTVDLVNQTGESQDLYCSY